MTVEEFAAAYGITFRNVTRIPKEHCIPNSKLGVGCILEEKVVLIDPEMQKATKFQAGDLSDRKELVLHEVVHIIVQPPHMDIRVVPELAILLQFEQAVGQFLMPAMYEPIEHFQMPTDIKLRGRGHRYYRTFRDLITPAKLKEWQGRGDNKCPEHQLVYENYHFMRGRKFCQRLGIIGPDWKPVLGKYPDWKGNLTAFRKLCRLVKPQKPLPYGLRRRWGEGRLGGIEAKFITAPEGAPSLPDIDVDPQPPGFANPPLGAGLMAQGTLVLTEGFDPGRVGT